MKEKLTLQAIRADFSRVATHHALNQTGNLLGYSIAFALPAGIACLIFKSLFPALLLSPGIVLFAVLFAKELKSDRKNKRAIRAAIERSDISIVVEAFSHIVEERIVEPHPGYRHTHLTKVVPFCYFASGGSWRIPLGDRLYSWSKTHSLSPTGLRNISLQGDTFFYVSLQGYPDICYAYPCKFFELDKTLSASQTAK